VNVCEHVQRAVNALLRPHLGIVDINDVDVVRLEGPHVVDSQAVPPSVLMGNEMKQLCRCSAMGCDEWKPLQGVENRQGRASHAGLWAKTVGSLEQVMNVVHVRKQRRVRMILAAHEE